MILQLLSYVGAIVGFVFLVLAIAAALYYISELVEEHLEPTKRLLTRLIYCVMGIFVLLVVVDRFPIMLTAFSIFSYWVYLINLSRFPYVELSSPVFLVSCVLVIANHFLWFSHFHNPYIPPIEERLKHDYIPPRIPLFMEVCSFFGLCVWFVPFALFVSLSAHDNLLPHHIAVSNDHDKKKNNGLAKVVVAHLREFVYSVSRRLGYELDPNHGRIA